MLIAKTVSKKRKKGKKRKISVKKKRELKYPCLQEGGVLSTLISDM